MFHMIKQFMNPIMCPELQQLRQKQSARNLYQPFKERSDYISMDLSLSNW